MNRLDAYTPNTPLPRSDNFDGKLSPRLDKSSPDVKPRRPRRQPSDDGRVRTRDIYRHNMRALPATTFLKRATGTNCQPRLPVNLDFLNGTGPILSCNADDASVISDVTLDAAFSNDSVEPLVENRWAA